MPHRSPLRSDAIQRFVKTFSRTFVFFALVPVCSAANHIVTMINFSLNPRDIVINVGDSITWSNRDFVLHDTVSGTNGVPNGIWRSGLFGRGRTFTFTFNTPGGYGYYCTPHWQSFGMIGTVTVLPPPNNPPSVTITNPVSGQDFPAGANVLVEATASDSDGSVLQVEFFQNGISAGVVTNPPFGIILSNVSPGSYTLTATATDDAGATGLSPPVNFSVAGVPTVTLTSPTNGARFPIGTNIQFVAEAMAPGGLAKVEFFANGNSIAQFSAAPLEFDFAPGAAGDYTLTALVTDVLGQTNISPEVKIRVFIPETNRPTLTITNSPKNFTRLYSDSLSLAGRATDDVGLDYVEFQINDGTFQRAGGTSNWQAIIALPPGNDVVRLRCVDFAGNTSAVVTRFFTFVLNTPLTVMLNGQGSVTPTLNGRKLEAGQLYSLTAKPAGNFIFSNWLANGAVISINPVLGFRMESNLTLTANFATNPFVAGNYAGLFTNDTPSPESSGLFALRLGANGKFTGKLAMNHERSAFGGRFDARGRGAGVILRRGRSPIAVGMILDLTNGTDWVTGNVTSGEWSAQLFARRSANPAPQSGNYSFDLVNLTNGTHEPAVAGKIRSSGAATFTSAFNGKKFNLNSRVSANGDCPFYFPLTDNEEIVFGWLRFVDPSALPEGTLWRIDSNTNSLPIQLGVAAP